MALDPTPVPQADVFTADIYPPLAGSPVQAADVAAGEEALANRTKYTNDLLAIEIASRATDEANIRAHVPVIQRAIAALALVDPGDPSVETIAATPLGGTKSTTVLLTVPNDAAVGDVLRVELAMDYGSFSAVGSTYAELLAIQDYGLTNIQAVIPGAVFAFTGTVARGRLTLVGQFTVAVAGTIHVVLNVRVGVGEDWYSFGTGALLAELSHTGY